MYKTFNQEIPPTESTTTISRAQHTHPKHHKATIKTLKIIDYNRVVKDLNGHTPAQILELPKKNPPN